ncbi:hypothetical protein [uncultured Aquimarina sp.]|uniref:hypothetical protein n=1 Tax=uncultured Aquimarina sp. TaxID=575652 RepID=UPI002610565F|nr:hypothetical protein [uncultured Aquimarina sp.]
MGGFYIFLRKVTSFKGFWPIVVGSIILIINIFLLEKQMRPVYSIEKSPSLIYDSTSYSSKIKLYTNDSVTVDKNVYVVSMLIWNNGKLSITKERIRKDFELKVIDGDIIDYKIVKENNKGVSNFKLLPTKEGLKLDWGYFDGGDGVIIQLIYTGNSSSEAVLSGFVEGGQVKKLDYVEINYKDPRFFVVIGLFLIISVLLYFLFNSVKTSKAYYPQEIERISLRIDNLSQSIENKEDINLENIQKEINYFEEYRDKLNDDRDKAYKLNKFVLYFCRGAVFFLVLLLISGFVYTTMIIPNSPF